MGNGKRDKWKEGNWEKMSFVELESPSYHNFCNGRNFPCHRFCVSKHNIEENTVKKMLSIQILSSMNKRMKIVRISGLSHTCIIHTHHSGTDFLKSENNWKFVAWAIIKMCRQETERNWKLKLNFLPKTKNWTWNLHHHQRTCIYCKSILPCKLHS